MQTMLFVSRLGLAWMLAFIAFNAYAAAPVTAQDDPALAGAEDQFIEDPRVRLLPDNPGFTTSLVGMRVASMIRRLRLDIVAPASVPSPVAVPGTPGGGASVQNICSPTARSGVTQVNVNCVVLGSTSFGNK